MAGRLGWNASLKPETTVRAAPLSPGRIAGTVTVGRLTTLVPTSIISRLGCRRSKSPLSPSKIAVVTGADGVMAVCQRGPTLQVAPQCAYNQLNKSRKQSALIARRAVQPPLQISLSVFI